MQELVIDRYHANSLLLYIQVIELAETGVHAVVHITHKEADVTQMVNLESRYVILYMLQLKLTYQLPRHLVPLLPRALTMPEMRRNNIEMAILKTEVVSDAPFVSDHTPHSSFGNFSPINVAQISSQVSLDKTHQEHLPHLQKLC